MALEHDFSEFRFTSDALPERERVAYTREEFGRKISRYDFEPLGGAFRFDIKLRAAPDLALVSTEHSPMRIQRTAELLTDGDDTLVLQISMSRGLASQLGREIEVEPGDAMLGSNSDVGTFTFPSANSKCVLLGMSRARLRPLLKEFDLALVRRVPAQTQALQLLMQYLSMLGQMPSLAPEVRRLTVDHVYELVSVALGATRDAAEAARQNGMRATRRNAIKADILENLPRRGLSAEMLSKTHGVTASYIRKLFADENMSFTDFVLEQRLLLSYRTLKDMRYANRTISSIAFDAGFSDLSYFNRAFRRRFGMTPSDARETAWHK